MSHAPNAAMLCATQARSISTNIHYAPSRRQSPRNIMEDLHPGATFMLKLRLNNVLTFAGSSDSSTPSTSVSNLCRSCNVNPRSPVRPPYILPLCLPPPPPTPAPPWPAAPAAAAAAASRGISSASSPTRGVYCLLSILRFLPSPSAPARRALALLANQLGDRPRPGASPASPPAPPSGLSDPAPRGASGCACDFRNALNSPGANSGCKCAGTQKSEPSSSPSGAARVTSSFDVKEGVCRDEVDEGGDGGRSGSTASAPGPGVDILRRRRFLDGSVLEVIGGLGLGLGGWYRCRLCRRLLGHRMAPA